MRVLFLTTVLPGKICNGGELWSQTVVDSLRRCGAKVVVLGYQRPGTLPEPGEVGAGVRSIETHAGNFHAGVWALRSIGRRAYTVQKWKGSAYQTQLARVTADGNWSLVVVDHVQMGWTLPHLRAIPVIYLAHHAEQALYARLAASARFLKRWIYRRESRLVGRIERTLLQAAWENWCISEKDAEQLRPWAGGRVRALPPLCREPREWLASQYDGPHVALLGNWRWQPNRHALQWFLDHVQPRLPKDWRVEIGGSVDLAGLTMAEQVRFRGPVRDASAFLRRGGRIAVPSHAAEGANLKLLDAIASGRPVVTSASAAQLAGELPPDVAVVDSAEAFAAALVRTPVVDLAARSRWMAARRTALDTAVAAALSNLSASRDDM